MNKKFTVSFCILFLCAALSGCADANGAASANNGGFRASTDIFKW